MLSRENIIKISEIFQHAKSECSTVSSILELLCSGNFKYTSKQQEYKLKKLLNDITISQSKLDSVECDGNNTIRTERKKLSIIILKLQDILEDELKNLSKSN